MVVSGNGWRLKHVWDESDNSLGMEYVSFL